MIINKTPHPVNIVNPDGSLIHTFPKCEEADLIRLSVNTEPNDNIDGFPTSVTVFGEPTGLPEYKEGTFYVVSQLVKNALPERKDLLVPAEVLRGDQGIILGCKSLGR